MTGCGDAGALAAAFESADLAALTGEARALRDAGHGELISYSPKVFLPLTHLCRDVCRYCTFARPPRPGTPVYMGIDEVLGVARAGAARGCREALFTLGDRPELRWRQAREALDAMGFGTTLDYLAHVGRAVIEETGLLPHFNPGIMDLATLERLRSCAPSMGLMLESASDRLMAPRGPHHGCPDKAPSVRLQVIEDAGRARIPFTTGLLIGIGETRRERIEALLAIRQAHARHGHIQELIIQPFRAKPGTPMARFAEPPLDDLVWTIAVARILFGPEANIQSPPNLAPGDIPQLLAAGINDLGGISPLTPDFVNPEAPWPEVMRLAGEIGACGKRLVERLAIYPSFARAATEWTDPLVAPAVLGAIDASGRPREDDWLSGQSDRPPHWAVRHPPAVASAAPIAAALRRSEAGRPLDEAEVASLFEARGSDHAAICQHADALRRAQVGNAVSYVVTRNINYTNICSFRCGFCAFSKGRVAEGLRAPAYMLDLDEIAGRAAEAQARGATEICLQGGIHPAYDGQTYLDILAAARRGAPGIHVHAFSPLEVMHGARSLGLPLRDYLTELRARGLGSLPGTAAEILDDEIRAVICPDKLSTREWLETVRTAHEVGLPTTATIMFGHVDSYVHWARHLLHLRSLQAETGGFTEFVPLPFVAAEAPIYRRGRARRGPTFREAVLMHAVARIVLGDSFANVQTSWVKMGSTGGTLCLGAGANDFGGTLMNETITRSAGAIHGQEMTPAQFESLIAGIGRTSWQRTTLYRPVSPAPASEAPIVGRATR